MKNNQISFWARNIQYRIESHNGTEYIVPVSEQTYLYNPLENEYELHWIVTDEVEPHKRDTFPLAIHDLMLDEISFRGSAHGRTETIWSAVPFKKKSRQQDY